MRRGMPGRLELTGWWLDGPSASVESMGSRIGRVAHPAASAQ